MNIQTIPLKNLKPWGKNPRESLDLERLKKLLAKRGQTQLLLIDGRDNSTVLGGNMRLKAMHDLGWDTAQCNVVVPKDDKDAVEMALEDNEQFGKYVHEQLIELVQEFNIDTDITIASEPIRIADILPEEEKEGLTDADDVPELEKGIQVIKAGDVIELGQHRVMCGDSTDTVQVEKLMNGAKADMGFNDPPYGMKKEKEGVTNDNLNINKLLEFNRQWIAIQLKFLVDNGSFYCWGVDEPLMDIYGSICKPLIEEGAATFRNLVTWDKGSGQGQTTESFRMFPIADEKCIFFMKGVQGFNTNADNYFEGWEPIRDYLLQSRLAMGWDVPTMKKVVGHSDLLRDHWTSKSQFNFPTREVYNKMKAEADKVTTSSKKNTMSSKKNITPPAHTLTTHTIT